MKLSDDPKFQEIKQRSMSADGNMYCGSCYYSYVLTGFACHLHITDEERADRDEMMKTYLSEVKLEHPFFTAVKNKRYR